MWDSLGTRKTLPERLVILGGGPIGVEMAQAFARLGSRVTLVQSGERILPREDADAAAFVAETLAGEGVDIPHRPRRQYDAEGKSLIVGAGGEESPSPFDDLIVAVGRKPRAEGYGIETLGIDTDRPLETNAWLETLFPNIYAVGDVVRAYLFTHAASHQAWHAAVNALFGRFKRFRVDYGVLPGSPSPIPKSPMSATMRRARGRPDAPMSWSATTSLISTVPSPRAPVAASSNCLSRLARTGSSARPLSRSPCRRADRRDRTGDEAPSRP